MKKQYSSKQRKLHNLKRINCVLGEKRRRYEKDMLEMLSCSLNCNSYTLNIVFDSIARMSEKIGKNSAKIQRLRTQIQQSKSLSTSEEKKLNEHSSGA